LRCRGVDAHAHPPALGRAPERRRLRLLDRRLAADANQLLNGGHEFSLSVLFLLPAGIGRLETSGEYTRTSRTRVVAGTTAAQRRAAAPTAYVKNGRRRADEVKVPRAGRASATAAPAAVGTPASRPRRAPSARDRVRLRHRRRPPGPRPAPMSRPPRR